VLTFQVAGEMDVEHAGSHALRAGDIHVIPAGDQHRITRALDADVWCAALKPAELDRERFQPLLAPFESIARGALPRVSLPAGRRDFVASLFAELGALDGRREPAVRSESLVALLLAEIGDHTPAAALAVTPTARRSDVTAHALAFIAANALAPLSLADVARGIGRNRSHVADVVRRETGRSVGAWISEVRLDEARRRLEETDELIEVIAERVGYADSTHFTRTFKRRYGLAPRAWRNLQVGLRPSLREPPRNPT
jgi:AraC-like DNA-binding protein